MTSARLALASLMCVASLAACGGDDAGADPASPSTTSTESTAASAETPSPSETTPTVEPADGRKLKHDLAEITMPKGWTEQDNFGVPFIRQGADTFGALTFSELGGEDDQATSLDRIAKRQLRIGAEPGVKRMDDVVLGDGTRAYRLAGRVNSVTYDETYGSLIGNIEYVLEFSFTTEYGTIAEAKEIIASMLATWDFNP
ncbi:MULTISPECIES: hypothetical protein [Nocardioides]|uniref:hypothetical protein n=1 Tax=Nocardioides TaxID=1839 RepID=UPI00040BF5B6|nr:MULTISPECIES: hypothetical protein [Nocardioides]